MVYNVDTVIGLKFLLWVDEADWADGADRVDRTNETDVAEMTIRILYKSRLGLLLNFNIVYWFASQMLDGPKIQLPCVTNGRKVLKN